MKNKVATFAAILLASSALQAQIDPVREGAGARREALTEMELKPFPASAWSTLTDWTGGEGLDTAQTDGKVVVIMTWAAWSPHSKGALRTAKKLVERHNSDDLIVVGVHDARRWDAAAAKAGEGLLLAHDADGTFRKTLHVDQDPDFYLIDRSGNLRFADVETSAVSGAVTLLLAESRADAIDHPDKLARSAEAIAAAQRRSVAVQKELDLSDMPDMTFIAPPSARYEQANWPSRWLTFETDVLDIGNNFRSGGGTAYRSFDPPESSPNMFGRAPRSFDGRVTVMYFWTPDSVGSYERIQPLMDALQRERWRDVNVIGVMCRIPPRSTRLRGAAIFEADEASRKEFADLVKYAKTKRTYDHTIIADADNAVLTALLGLEENRGRRGTIDVRFSSVAVFSSDKTMRFVGLPTESHFRTALAQTLKVDPGVAVRRAAEDVWIKQNKE